MQLPESIRSFTLSLPWDTDIGGEVVDQVVCDFRLVNQRIDSNVKFGEYQNNGIAALPTTFSAGFVLAVDRYSFDNMSSIFQENLFRSLAYWIARYLVNKEVIQNTPAGRLDPTGIEWPLTADVVDYLDNGGISVPVPLGRFSAFRIFPASEYLTASVELNRYWGNPPAS